MRIETSRAHRRSRPPLSDELRSQRVEGEVVVQFRVNEKGRVEPSTMRVMQSEHELFTAAVRRAAAVPLRAGTLGGPDSKPQSALVQFRDEVHRTEVGRTDRGCRHGVLPLHRVGGTLRARPPRWSLRNRIARARD